MNMTTVPSNQLKAMQQEIESLKEQVALLSRRATKAMQVENYKLREQSMQFAIDLETERNLVATLQSPKILQARDERVAEACAKVCINQADGIANSTPVTKDCSESSVRESVLRIRSDK